MQIPYRAVEVNPLTKKQLKWTSHKKVPVVLIDNELVDDSSLILSRLAVEYEPEVESPKGWFQRNVKVGHSTRIYFHLFFLPQEHIDAKHIDSGTCNMKTGEQEST